ncbi:hypothetical protein GCM10009760_41290 [Kitasatospora kazusensis]|uniref:Methyltransferase family protein n=1 Tax=Kitasatospora kazusensis TaxID=407974 RepID=A0ABN2ZW83_9ACTN
MVSLHTSFGFFDTDEENLAVLREAHDALAPGGRLLIDVMDRDRFLTRSGESFGTAPDEFAIRNFDAGTGTTYLYEERFTPLTSRIRWNIDAFDTTSGTVGRSVTADYRVYSAHELTALLTRAGFTTAGLYGDYDLAPFHIHSPHLICTATRATAPRK